MVVPPGSSNRSIFFCSLVKASKRSDGILGDVESNRSPIMIVRKLNVCGSGAYKGMNDIHK